MIHQLLDSGGVTNHGPETRISELYTVGGTLSFTILRCIHCSHRSVEFEVRPDTEANCSGNISKTDTGTEVGGQDRTMTVTTSSTWID